MNTTERGIREQFPLWRDVGPLPCTASADAAYAVIGCGTSLYIADSIATSLCRQGFMARAVPGGEWISRRRDYFPTDATLQVLALSRSGESTETVQAAAISRAAGIPVIAVTCAPGSSLTRQADRVLLATTHPDEGIVMTASASLMLMMGLRFAGIAVGAADAQAAEMLMRGFERQLPAGLDRWTHVVFLGGGSLYGIAREGALKLQEMSLSHTEAYHPLEYRHGPVSLIDASSLVVMLYDPRTRAEETALANELRRKGALVIGFGGAGDLSFALPEPAATRGLVCLPSLQLFGERMAVARGVNSEAPRHLTKVVRTA